jgi:hypothetical protein
MVCVLLEEGGGSKKKQDPPTINRYEQPTATLKSPCGHMDFAVRVQSGHMACGVTAPQPSVMTI